MYLSVFHEFCSRKVLDDVRDSCPNLEIKISTPVDGPQAKYNAILRTNAKLFYEKNTSKNDVDIILSLLKDCGLNIKIRDPFAIYKERKTINIPSDEVEYKTCECGNTIRVPKKPETKEVVVEVKHYFNDRVILEVDDLLRGPTVNDVIFRLGKPPINPHSPYQYTGMICTPEGPRIPFKRG